MKRFPKRPMKRPQIQIQIQNRADQSRYIGRRPPPQKIKAALCRLNRCLKDGCIWRLRWGIKTRTGSFKNSRIGAPL